MSLNDYESVDDTNIRLKDNFRTMGLFFPLKEYNSASDAVKSLQQNKIRMTQQLTMAKDR